jgi:putative SOS response-associated peptidase YedK
MCYNKSVTQREAEMRKHSELMKRVKNLSLFDKDPQYNALRLQHLPIIAHRDGGLEAFKAMWWLIPQWSKSGKPESTAFNARAETIETSPLFAPYFKRQRCLVPVSAFYEYPPTEFVDIQKEGKKKKVKQPYLIRMKDKAPFSMAGIYSVWVNKQTGEELPSYAVITTSANSLMEKIHHRMPVILDEKEYEPWLDPEFGDSKTLKNLLAPYPPKNMEAYKVSAEYLYDRSHNDKKCWQPLEE